MTDRVVDLGELGADELLVRIRGPRRRPVDMTGRGRSDLAGHVEPRLAGRELCLVVVDEFLDRVCEAAALADAGTPALLDVGVRVVEPGPAYRRAGTGDRGEAKREWRFTPP